MSHPNSSGTLGTIEWEITEEPAGRTIYRGSRDIERKDIEITKIPTLPFLPALVQIWPRMIPKPRFLSAIESALSSEEELYRKRIHLQGNFYFDLVERPVRQRKNVLGFGLTARHEMTPTFSWEWFTIDGREHATKLKEGGELRIGVERGRSGWEVGYTEFLTDVSLRMRVREGLPWRDPGPRWRIRIFKGSRVIWPSVDDIER